MCCKNDTSTFNFVSLDQHCNLGDYNIILYLSLNPSNSYKIFRILVKYEFLVVSTCTVFALVGYQFYYCEATVVK